MGACLVFLLLFAVLSFTGEVKGVVKSTSLGSLKNGTIKHHLCTTCKVTQKVGNNTVNNGKKIILKCAFSGVSAKNITWFKDGKRIKEGRRNKDGKRIKESRHSVKRLNENILKLRIRNVMASDRGWYRCVGHNVQGLIIASAGYLKVTNKKKGSHRNCADKTQGPCRDPSQVKPTGQCELYKGKICSPYISDSTSIFVDIQERENKQDFIEKRLSYGNAAMNNKLSNSCKPFSLALLCHYHFPECSLIKSTLQPKMICKDECEQIKTKHCKTEYMLAQTGNSKDDIFPDCNTLPKDITKGSCISLSRHKLQVRIIPGSKSNSKSGRCTKYSGNLCQRQRGKKVFVSVNTTPGAIEQIIKDTLKKIKGSGLTPKCQPYVLPLLCQLRFPDCDDSSSPPKGKPICKDECLVLRDKYCEKEYLSAAEQRSRGVSALSFDCSSLKPHSLTSGKCSVIGVPKKDLNKGNTKISSTEPPRVGLCTPYAGTICKQFIDTKRTIFVEFHSPQVNIEKKVEAAIKAINSLPKVSAKCRPFVLPLMCHHLFPYCDSDSTQPRPSHICRRDCLHIQQKFCPAEYEIAKKQDLTGDLLFPHCSTLSKSTNGCISLRKLFRPNKMGPTPGDCYDAKGGGYRGYVNTTESGITCQRWNVGQPHVHRLTAAEYPELHGRHNLCRNPGGKREKPWCFTTDPKRLLEMCNIPKCVDAPFNGTGEDYLGTVNKTTSGKICEPWSKHEPKHKWAHNYCRNPNGSNKPAPWCYVGENAWELCDIPRVSARSYPEKNGHLKNLLYTIIPCVVFGFVVGVFIIVVCWKRHKQGPDSLKKNTPHAIPVFLPELKTIPADNIVVSKYIGNGRFGALYHGEIHNSSEDGRCSEERITRFVKVAIKECRDEFITQAKKWSQFHHPNIFTIEAITSGEDPVRLVFEYAAHGCLYQYLIHHSPNNPNYTRDHVLLSKANRLDIARQIAAGMNYLSSNHYIHGDLMTRNCLVSHSMVIKITDFSIDRDTCYYRRPNKRPIPVGWMAPEIIDTEVFTTHSDVWSFGVVLWEIFTFGFQPYYGYKYIEVRKMILSLKLLDRPQDCFPLVYELMRKCWNKEPTLRPRFLDLYEDLNTFAETLLEEYDLTDHHDEIHSLASTSSC